MRVRWVTLVCALPAASALWGAPWVPPVRDGAWLQNGIKQQQRWNAHENLSDKDLSDATLVASYICAVVDLEKETAQRPATLSQALQDGRKKKKRLNPPLFEGMNQVVPMLVPLMNSNFITDGPSCERANVIVQEYLAQYPEMLDKDAAAVIEKALLATYSPSR